MMMIFSKIGKKTKIKYWLIIHFIYFISLLSLWRSTNLSRRCRIE